MIKNVISLAATMDGSEVQSISRMLVPLEDLEGAQLVLKLMRERYGALLLLCDEEHPTEALNDAVCQHIAELGLKEILDTIKSEPIDDKHLYVGAVLVSIKDIHMVKKYIWRDKHFLGAMSRLLKHEVDTKNVNYFRDIVACIIHGLVLGGTPTSFFELIESSEIVELYSDIFENRAKVVFPLSHDKLILSLLIMCQNSGKVVHKCKLLNTAKSLDAFSRWNVLDAEIKDKAQVASRCIQHMTYQDELPEYKRYVFDRFSEHIHHKNQMCKRLETVLCSYKKCAKVQPDAVEGRFKKCARCRLALYCSKECQKAHWISGHSEVCVPPQDT